ncbi:MAG: dTDP-4-keto-6-deoxy-D-glucose epimerase [Sinobacteraceae bacterium]|nr:dTDP-4-keto-6-deoxy-D-glucose epimerase [Nevskiaceae bacterium]
MSRFDIQSLPLAGLNQIRRKPIGDDRGSLERLFCQDDLAAAGWRKPIAQVNLTRTVARGTVRGLHYQQPPHAEMKLVTCLRGEVFDVIVDLRQGSNTFLHWHAVHLSAQEPVSVLIPEGCAHGFQSLVDDVELLYFHSSPYCAAAEVGLRPTDPALGIRWPLPVSTLSARDAAHPLLEDDFFGTKS